MSRCIPVLVLALAICLGPAWASPARALVTPEEAKKLGTSSGRQSAAQQQSPQAPAAGTIRTQDGTVITVPKAKTAPRQGGTSVKEKE